jgi:hypothetical protein
MLEESINDTSNDWSWHVQETIEGVVGTSWICHLFLPGEKCPLIWSEFYPANATEPTVRQRAFARLREQHSRLSQPKPPIDRPWTFSDYRDDSDRWLLENFRKHLSVEQYTELFGVPPLPQTVTTSKGKLRDEAVRKEVIEEVLHAVLSMGCEFKDGPSYELIVERIKSLHLQPDLPNQD